MPSSYFLWQSLALVCPVAALLVIGGGLFAWTVWRDRRHTQAVIARAARRGVSLDHPVHYPTFEATLDGARVKVTHVLDRLRRGRRRRRRWSYTVAVEVPVSTGDLSLRPHAGALADFLDQVTGQKDVVVGDESFDRTFVVGTLHDDAARTFLGPHARSALLAAHQRLLQLGFGGVFVHRNTVLVHGRGHVPVESLDALVPVLAQAARGLAGR
jgi:hypothetical protein